jgi:hypothetical protein
MASWWHRDVIAPGKLPLMLCFLAFVTTFAVTRAITRMIRDGRGPFRNQVTASGTHIHHSVPGIILLMRMPATAMIRPAVTSCGPADAPALADPAVSRQVAAVRRAESVWNMVLPGGVKPCGGLGTGVPESPPEVS